LQIPN